MRGKIVLDFYRMPHGNGCCCETFGRFGYLFIYFGERVESFLIMPDFFFFFGAFFLIFK